MTDYVFGIMAGSLHNKPEHFSLTEQSGGGGGQH